MGAINQSDRTGEKDKTDSVPVPDIAQVGRTTVFTWHHFDQLTSVFVIEGKKRRFLIDTFCGEAAMQQVLAHLKDREEKPLCVINTHFHWDHIWGNSAFGQDQIWAHEGCEQLVRKHWENEWRDNARWRTGAVSMQLPGHFVQEAFRFDEEGVQLFHSPGHTVDSLSVWDEVDRFLFVGDNVEKPLVWVEQPDVVQYVKTLKRYTGLPVEGLFSSHTWPLTMTDVLAAIRYLESLLSGDPLFFDDERVSALHQLNLHVAAQT